MKDYVELKYWDETEKEIDGSIYFVVEGNTFFNGESEPFSGRESEKLLLLFSWSEHMEGIAYIIFRALMKRNKFFKS